MATEAPTASDVAKLNYAANDAAIAHKEALPSSPSKVDESRVGRFRVGDVVEYEDTSVFPYEKHTGEVTGFDNVEGTYLIIQFGKKEKVLTEDEVIRVG